MKNEVEEAVDALVQHGHIGRSFRREDFPFSPLKSEQDYRTRRAHLILAIKTTQMESVALPWETGGEYLFRQQQLLEHALDQLDTVWRDPLPRDGMWQNAARNRVAEELGRLATKPATLITG